MRETATNLRRNLTLTFATVVTVAVALTLVGASLLMNQGVTHSNVRFQGGVEFIVFMKPDASQEQIDAVRRAIDANPHVSSERYLDQDEAYAEFRLSSRTSRRSATASRPPRRRPATRCRCKDASFEVVQSLQDQFKTQPGVQEVVAPTDTVKRQEDSFAKFSNFSLLFAAIVRRDLARAHREHHPHGDVRPPA